MTVSLISRAFLLAQRILAIQQKYLPQLARIPCLPAIEPFNKASHPIPPQIAAESSSANQITKRGFTQPGTPKLKSSSNFAVLRRADATLNGDTGQLETVA
jgi:hypothetical protein